MQEAGSNQQGAEGIGRSMTIVSVGAAPVAAGASDDAFNLDAVQKALVAVEAQEAQQSEALVAEAFHTFTLSQQALDKQMMQNEEFRLASQQQRAKLSQTLASLQADTKLLASTINQQERTIADLQTKLQVARAEIAKRNAAEESKRQLIAKLIRGGFAL